jgi:hypothetical protein
MFTATLVALGYALPADYNPGIGAFEDHRIAGHRACENKFMRVKDGMRPSRAIVDIWHLVGVCLVQEREN